MINFGINWTACSYPYNGVICVRWLQGHSARNGYNDNAKFMKIIYVELLFHD